MSEKRKCSGIFCRMQRSTINPAQCNCTETCPDFTPAADFSKMEAVIELAEKQFGIEDEKDKEKLRILFNAYVGQYVATCCYPVGGVIPK